MSGQNTLEFRKVVEYSSFFVGEESIDIGETLKQYNRNMLIRMAVVLSHHYGNMSMPNDLHTLFSDSSKKHKSYLNKLFADYYKREKLGENQKVEVLTYRTSLELWRRIFSLRVEEYRNDIDEESIELMLFKVILTINEKLVSFKEKKEQYRLDELLFLSGFLTNDNNHYDFRAIIQPQMYYFQQLVDFIPSNEVLTKATEKLFFGWGIKSWQPYYTTIICIASETDKYIKNNWSGVPIISPKWISNNQENGFLSASLIECLSIEEDAYLPFDDEDVESKALNVDYRYFRSKPLVKLRDGSGYVVINNQLLCERLFNSLYFDFNPLINGKKGSCGFFDYNKWFVEKVLFRNTFYNCLPSNCFTFPVRGIEQEEKDHAPDFYARTKRCELILVECKAIKMNGECRDDGDYVRFLDELHEKIVLKTRNLDKTRKEHKGEPEAIGVGQLIHHIDSIDADTFEWDSNIPDDVSYYPMLVFEDVKFVQTGILSIVNQWFYEELGKKKELVLSEAIMPIMVVSINTLYLYDSLLAKKGICNMIDSFVKENATYDKNSGVYHISAVADFDQYLRYNPFKKTREAAKWLRKIMKVNN